MNIDWKIGVKAQASVLIGSTPGCAGTSGVGTGEGVGEAPEAPGAPVPAHAATTATRRASRKNGSQTGSPAQRRLTTPSRSADRVIATRVPGMTAGDPLRTHPAALEQAVLHDRLLRVAGAGGLEPAARRHPGEQDPVQPDQAHPDRLVDAHQAADPPSAPPLVSERRNAPTSASWSAATIAGRAMMRTSQPGWNEGAITLSASRSRRLTRFRTTAPPSFRPVDRPKRVVSRSVRTNLTVNSGWDWVVPDPP